MINRAPVGWLGFLGIKNFGRNPATAADVLAPTWDLAGLYLAANRTWVFTSAIITGLGNNQTGQVPPGQVWYVHSYSYNTAALAAGNELDFDIAHSQLTTGSSVILGGGPQVLPVVGSYGVATLPRPIILQSAETLGVYVKRFAGAAINASVNFCYTRLDA